MIYVHTNYSVTQYDTFDFKTEICSVQSFALENYSIRVYTTYCPNQDFLFLIDAL